MDKYEKSDWIELYGLGTQDVDVMVPRYCEPPSGPGGLPPEVDSPLAIRVQIDTNADLGRVLRLLGRATAFYATEREALLASVERAYERDTAFEDGADARGPSADVVREIEEVLRNAESDGNAA